MRVFVCFFVSSGFAYIYITEGGSNLKGTLMFPFLGDDKCGRNGLLGCGHVFCCDNPFLTTCRWWQLKNFVFSPLQFGMKNTFWLIKIKHVSTCFEYNWTQLSKITKMIKISIIFPFQMDWLKPPPRFRIDFRNATQLTVVVRSLKTLLSQRWDRRHQLLIPQKGDGHQLTRALREITYLHSGKLT